MRVVIVTDGGRLEASIRREVVARSVRRHFHTGMRCTMIRGTAFNLCSAGMIVVVDAAFGLRAALHGSVERFMFVADRTCAESSLRRFMIGRSMRRGLLCVRSLVVFRTAFDLRGR
jgi:hypothetical protein